MKVGAILIFGPPASGKNTICRLLLNNFKKAKYLQNHHIIDLVTQFFPFESEVAIKLIFTLRQAFLMQWADSGQGLLVANQFINCTPESDYVKLYKEFSEKLVNQEKITIVVKLQANKNTLLKRAYNSDRKNHRDVTPEKIIKFIEGCSFLESKHSLQALFPSARVIELDTELHSAKNCAEKILQKINEIES